MQYNLSVLHIEFIALVIELDTFAIELGTFALEFVHDKIGSSLALPAPSHEK